MATGSKKVIYAALIGNALIAITKFFAASITGSSAMVSEGIHSVVDTGNQGLLLYGMHRAQKPPDERFPFGHGKEIYFWSFAVAIMIFAVGAGISIYHGVGALLDPHPVEDYFINYIVLVLAMIFEGFAWWFAFKEFRRIKGKWGYFAAVQRSKSPTTFVVLFEDTAAMLGLWVAFIGLLIGQLTGNPYLDGAASIGIGIILAITAAWLAYETKGLLIGESAAPETVRDVRRLAAAMEGVENVNEVLTLHMGPEFIVVNMSVDFRDTLSASEVEGGVRALDRRIKRDHPEVKRVFIEVEDARANAAEREQLNFAADKPAGD